MAKNGIGTQLGCAPSENLWLAILKARFQSGRPLIIQPPWGIIPFSERG